MALTPGTRLGGYEILAQIGAGGMGEVYMARDSRLSRRIAIKLLPAAAAGDPERRERFEREAQAVAALNHPHIVTIHSVEQADGQFFLTMELVEGRSLAEAIPKAGLPLDRLLKIAIPVTDAIAAAHQKGITHRDLKPANIMLGEGEQEGRVKVLDFGLAKLAEAPAGATGATELPTTPITGHGRILGTVAYMSPEQAEGKAVDARSDLFSLGVVLYEMATGQRPFTGETSVSIISSIVKDTPKSVIELNPALPRELGRIVRRALVKDPSRRYQTAADLRNELEELKASLDSGELMELANRPSAMPRRRGVQLSWPVLAGLVVMTGVVGAWTLLRSHSPQPAAKDLIPIPLTVYPGDQRDPAFSPDGNQVSFSWGPQGGVTNMYVKVVGAGNPVRLTSTEGTDRMSQWSPDGRWIAFTRTLGAQLGGRNGTASNMSVVVIPALGGPERTISPTTFHASWTPDSQSLVVPDSGSLYLVPLHGGGRRLLLENCRAGAISPDGDMLAALCGTGGLQVLRLAGEYAASGTPRPVTPPDWVISSWSWTPDSNELIFVRSVGNPNLGGDSFMYRVAVAAGVPERIEYAGDNPWFLDVAKRGNRLAYTRLKVDINLYRADLEADGTLRRPGQVIASTSRRELDAMYSPDGSRMAFTSNRSGRDEIWIAKSDGSNLEQVTNSPNPEGSGSPQWSPDGSQIAYSARPAGAAAADIFVMPASGGTPKQLTTDPANDVRPFWSRDGLWVYFASNREGRAGIWRVASTGGPATHVATGAYAGAAESPDGRWLYEVLSDEIVRFPTAGDLAPGQAPQVVGRDRIGTGVLAVTTRGVYYLSPTPDLQSADFRVLPLDGGTPRTLGTIPHIVSSGLSVSSDFKSILYSQCDQCAADIMLVENFH